MTRPDIARWSRPCEDWGGRTPPKRSSGSSKRWRGTTDADPFHRHLRLRGLGAGARRQTARERGHRLRRGCLPAADRQLDTGREHGGRGAGCVFVGGAYPPGVFDPRPKFLPFAPQLAVLTNIDWDHPDVFPDPAAYEAVFRQFLEYLGQEDRLIANADDPTVRRLLSRTRANVETYGLRGGADW